MKLGVIIIGILLTGMACAQNECAEWQRAKFKSKVDCEEATKVITEWDKRCTDIETKAGPWPENLSAVDRSTYAFCHIEEAKQTVTSVLSSHQENEQVQGFWKTLRGPVISHWEDTKEVFCSFHASAVYLVEGDHNGAYCAANAQYSGVPDKKKMDELFLEDETVSNNVITFFESQHCHDLPNSEDQKDCLQRLVDLNKSLIRALKNNKH